VGARAAQATPGSPDRLVFENHLTARIRRPHPTYQRLFTGKVWSFRPARPVRAALTRNGPDPQNEDNITGGGQGGARARHGVRRTGSGQVFRHEPEGRLLYLEGGFVGRDRSLRPGEHVADRSARRSTRFPWPDPSRPGTAARSGGGGGPRGRCSKDCPEVRSFIKLPSRRGRTARSGFSTGADRVAPRTQQVKRERVPERARAEGRRRRAAGARRCSYFDGSDPASRARSAVDDWGSIATADRAAGPEHHDVTVAALQLPEQGRRRPCGS
jgi:hypothetical protein